MASTIKSIRDIVGAWQGLNAAVGAGLTKLRTELFDTLMTLEPPGSPVSVPAGRQGANDKWERKNALAHFCETRRVLRNKKPCG